MSDIHAVTDEWRLGYEDGFGSFEKQLESADYLDGYDAGEATASGDTEPLTREEQEEVYGIERGE
jgi:hypothetical protein